MKLEDTREAYGESTGKASDIARQLALAALAVVWIFKVSRGNGEIAVPRPLVFPAALAVLALALDLMQYIYKSAAWGLFNRSKEKELELREDVEFDAPRWINWPAFGFFCLKLVAVVWSHLLLLKYLLSTVAHG